MSIMLKRNSTAIWLLPVLAVSACVSSKNSIHIHQPNTLYHIIHMGQSLGSGDQSLPLVTTSNTGFGNLRFKTGTHTWSNNYFPSEPEKRHDSLFTFEPLTAVQRGGEGETIANGMADHLTSQIKSTTGKEFRFLFSYAGQGGRYLRELNKRHDDAKDERAGTRRSGGGYYKTSIDDVRRAKQQADRLGIPYEVFSVSWMQGEANGARKLNRWDSAIPSSELIKLYKKDLIDLKNDYLSDIKGITKQKNRIPFLTYQTAGNLAAVAQLQASLEDKDIYMVGPTYMLPNAENGTYIIKEGGPLLHGDGIHLTADGERWLGEQFGKVARRIKVENIDWKPLYPVKAWRNKQSQSISVQFHVPVGHLQLDTTWLPMQDNAAGFVVLNGQNKKLPIHSVSIHSRDIVTIKLEEAVPAGELSVNYGLQSKVADLPGKIIDIKTGQTYKDGHPAIDIVFEGNITGSVQKLLEEGVFYIANIVKDPNEFTNFIIREVSLNADGNTVFKGEVKDLRNQVSFKLGQRCTLLRRYSYGNLRDSDNELSTFTFSDGSYGSRKGKQYPLYNWCVAFDNLKVAQ